jgi:hypothetical protein
MIDEFTERMKQKQGRVTTKATMENLIEAYKRGLVEHIVFVVKQPDGEIKTGHSDANTTEILGMLEIGKIQVVEYMNGYEI